MPTDQTCHWIGKLFRGLWVCPGACIAFALIGYSVEALLRPYGPFRELPEALTVVVILIGMLALATMAIVCLVVGVSAGAQVAMSETVRLVRMARDGMAKRPDRGPTELQAASAPEGTGLEPEAGSTPEGTGTEPVAAPLREQGPGA